MSDPIIECKDVTKIYHQGKIEVPALRGITLSIEPGEFTVLAGSSGSGKTTLLNLIGALDKPTSGSIKLRGRELSKMSGHELAELRLREIGFVFQAYNLVPVLSAYENAEYVLLLQGIPAAERRKQVMEVLDKVGLKGLEKRLPAEFSGGQQQRVAVARAIAPKPTIVLADEPTANLDSKMGAELIELMHDLNQDYGVTFVFSSHDPKVIQRAARLIRLEDGRIIADEAGEHRAA